MAEEGQPQLHTRKDAHILYPYTPGNSYVASRIPASHYPLPFGTATPKRITSMQSSASIERNRPLTPTHGTSPPPETPRLPHTQPCQYYCLQSRVSATNLSHGLGRGVATAGCTLHGSFVMTVTVRYFSVCQRLRMTTACTE